MILAGGFLLLTSRVRYPQVCLVCADAGLGSGVSKSKRHRSNSVCHPTLSVCLGKLIFHIDYKMGLIFLTLPLYCCKN